MNLSRLSVQRPIFTTMVTLIVIVLGLASYSRLQIDLLPNIELTTASVRTTYEGASPEVMEQMVTQVLEEIISTVPNIEEITSTAQEGRSDIRVTFGWGTNIDAAAIDLQAAIENRLHDLPDDIDRPQVRKFDVNAFPVVILGISSDLDPVRLTELIEDEVTQRLSRVPGVAQVDIWGGFNREVRVELDPDRINALGFSLDAIRTALRDANLDRPTGTIEQGRYEVTLRAPAQFTSLEEISETVLAIRDGAPVRVADVAQVRDTYQRLTRHVRLNGERAVRIAIRKEPAANTVEVANGVLAEIDRLNERYPNLNAVPVIDQGNFIERSIQNVAQSVLYGGGLAILVLLFFLRNLRSTVAISLAIPISIIATFGLMYFGGLTVNLMTLGGLALGVGMMVDSSIVVLENVFRRRTEEGETASVAAAKGAHEVAPALLASTITTAVIFLPIIFIRGVAGQLFGELAYVVAFSLICSLGVAITVMPVLAAGLLRKPVVMEAQGDGLIARIRRTSEKWFQRLDSAYKNLLDASLRYRWIVLLASISALGGSLLLTPRIGTEFMPPSDEGEVRVSGETEVGTRLDIVDDLTRQMEEIVYPAVPEIVSAIATARDNQGEIRIGLVPATARTRSNTEIADDLRARLAGQIPGMEIRTRAPQGQFLLQRLLGTEGGIEIEIRGFDLDVLQSLSDQVYNELLEIPGITDASRSHDDGTPQQEIRLDRAKVADLGLSPRNITELLQTAIAGSRAGNYQVEGKAHRILVQLQDAERRSLDEVLDLTLTSAAGESVTVRNVVSTVPSRSPLEITRKNQQRYMTVSANISGRDLGAIARDIQARLDQIPRPEGYSLVIAGDFEEQQAAFGELTLSLLLALLLVYMVLACQYESLRDPFIVMLSTPLAAIGVILTLVLTDTTLNLQSAIGCILLGGIVVNNAILLVDQAGRLRADGWKVRAAVAEAGRRRLRPILMTTLTTVIGLFPLALGIGEGADAQAPMARAIIGGLTVSTLITLVLIPVAYTFFHSDKSKRKMA
ncbi:MAG TPA: efflux RND transporter permease subunit [Opitutales bacterium]|nr:efflux RND transporter permease subunit [Opitutales bacterium]